MKKIYFLKTCDTCTKILKQLDLDGFKLQEIKTSAISAKQLDELVRLSGSYEALFNRRAKKYKQMDLKLQALNEQDYRQLILSEYTFLKRPVVVDSDQIYIGNSKKNVALLLEHYPKH